MIYLKALRAIVLVVLIGITSGCTRFEQDNTSVKSTISNEISNNNTVKASDAEVKQKTCNLDWRIEEEYIDDIPTSYLYLYSKDNVQVECEVGDIIGHVESIEEYKDRYPEDGILPIVSWFGGGGAELVGRCIDENTIVIMIKTIGDIVGYGVDWHEYKEWCTVSIGYNEQGQVESLLNLQDRQSEKNESNLKNEKQVILEEKDFEVSDGENTITLGILYDELNINQKEIPSENTLMTEETIGEYFYKYYLNKYEDLEIISSNLNYNIYKENFDTYRIVGITLKTPLYKTNREVYVGCTEEQVKEKYGEGEYTVDDWGKESFTYRLDEKSINITYDENRKVQSIYLKVHAIEE